MLPFVYFRPASQYLYLSHPNPLPVGRAEGFLDVLMDISLESQNKAYRSMLYLINVLLTDFISGMKFEYRRKWTETIKNPAR